MRKERTRRTWLATVLVLALGSASSCARSWWGYMEEGAKLRDERQLAQAEGRFLAALELAERFPSEDELLTTLSVLADVYHAQGKYTQAEPLYKRSLSIAEKRFGLEHVATAHQLYSLAKLYRDQGRYAEAEPLFKQVLAIFERRENSGPVFFPTRLNLYHDLAILYRFQGKHTLAEPLDERALAFAREDLAYQERHLTQYLDSVARLRDEAERHRALQREAEAKKIESKARVEATGVRLVEGYVAASLGRLSKILYDLGKYAEAEALYQRVLRIDEKTLGPEHPSVALDLHNLAILYDRQGKYGEAEPLYKRALAIQEKNLGSENPDVALTLNRLAQLYVTQERYVEAEPLVTRALAISERALGLDHPNVATGLHTLAMLYSAQGQYAEAEPLYRRTLTIQEKVLGREHPLLAALLEDYATLLRKINRETEAAEMDVRAKAIRARRR